MGAVGFATATVSIPPQHSVGTLEIELAPSNALTLQVAGCEVLPTHVQVMTGGHHSKPLFPDTLQVRIRSAPNLFPADPDGSFPVLHRTRLQGLFSHATFGKHFELALRLPEDGRIVLHELAAGQDFEVELHDRLGGSLLKLAVPGLGPAEQRTLELPVQVASQPLSGRVVDARGAPAEGATVTFKVGSGREGGGCTRRTDSGGNFAFFPLLLPEGIQGTLVADREGDAPSPERQVRIGQDREIELTLAPASDLEILVVDVEGNPVQADRVASGGTPAKRLGRGRHLLRDLPPGGVMVKATISDRTFARECQASDGSVVLKVPVHGVLRVRHPSVERDPQTRLSASVSDAQGYSFDWMLGFEQGDDFEGSTLLVPGTYRLSLLWLFGEHRALPIPAPRQVEVCAGEETLVDFATDR
ncbi:MAG: carboxypeptidase-like regulatory domain-containing protein [Acidobacteria bacterium]|nr:carboxypeptidase-like regulatory domain-containing protein [Acidobacteriota bacterium]